MPTLFIVDDESAIRHAFGRMFRSPEYQLLEASTATEVLTLLESKRPDAIILDVYLPDADGLQTFLKIHQLDPRIPVILITGHGTTDLAIEAMKQGAFDYLLKPLDYDTLQEAVQRAIATSRLMNVPAIFPDSNPPPPQADVLIGSCPAMQNVYKAIGRVAGTNETVLILGESGTGKELIARAIYQHSSRSDQVFLPLNCGAIPEGLIESELFGHEKGAFTGAERKRIGKFEQCHRGTLFLDEVGELPLLAQVKFLRALQERRFERVGGTETIDVDVRVIAATNADLEKLVASGRFRSDLFFRLNVFTIKLPPLRDRAGDLESLTDFYLARFAREFNRPIPVIPDESRELLRKYSWPGNIRELQSVLKQALLQAGGAALLTDVLATNLRTVLPPPPTPEAPSSGVGIALDWERFISERLESGSKDLYAECLSLMERQLLTRLLQRTGGNQLRAAELLGITRGSLRHKLKTLGLALERTVRSEDDQDD